MEQEQELIEKIKTQVNEIITDKTPEMFEEKIKSLNLETLDKTEEIEKLKNDLLSISEKMTAMQNKGEAKGNSFQNIKAAFKEKEAGLKDVENGRNPKLSIYKEKTDNTPNMTTAQLTTESGGNAILDYRNTEAAMRMRTFAIEQFVTILMSSESVINYSDVIPVHDPSDKGYPAVVAENGLKPKIAFKIEERQATEEIIAADMFLTKQAWRNINRMSTLADQYLRGRTILKRNQTILAKAIAAGTATAFDPTTWTGGTVTAPNLYDVALALFNQIANSESWADDIQYLPNAAFCNYSDYTALNALKDGEENYLTKLNQLLPLIPMHKTEIPAGKILVGDFSLVEAYQTFGYEVSTGLVNDQFIRNQFTLLGETGLISFIKEYDKRAMIYADIAEVQTVLASSGS